MSESQNDDALARANLELRTKKATCIDGNLFFKGEISPETVETLKRENAIALINGHLGAITLMDEQNRVMITGWVANPAILKKQFPDVDIVDKSTIVSTQGFLVEQGIAKPAPQREFRRGA